MSAQSDIPEIEGMPFPLNNEDSFQKDFLALSEFGSDEALDTTPPAPIADGDEDEAPLADEPVAEPAAEPAVEAEAAPPSELETLRQQVAELTKLLAGKAVSADNATPQQPSSSSVPEIPSYAYAVPDKMVEDLSDEEPAVRSRALSALISMIGQTIHREVLTAADKRMQAVLAERETHSARTASQQSISADFYGAFPDLSDPALAPIVNAVYTQVIAETRASEWTPELRDAIGARVRVLTGRTPTQGGNKPTSVSKPPVLVSGKTAPNKTGQKLTGQQAIMAETFG